MFIKKLRQKKHISQDQLAESAGLSLRTIQRVESGHRVSYASLRSLAATFKIDVDILEQELYTMDKVIHEYKDFPFWVRFTLGSGCFSYSRQQFIKIERFLAPVGILFCLVWISSFIWDMTIKSLPFFQDIGNVIGFVGAVYLITAYGAATSIRIGDRFDVWSKLETTQKTSFFKRMQK